MDNPRFDILKQVVTDRADLPLASLSDWERYIVVCHRKIENGRRRHKKLIDRKSFDKSIQYTPIGAKDIGENPQIALLLVNAAEYCHAQACSLRERIGADLEESSRGQRRQVVSRLRKASGYVDFLGELLRDPSSQSTPVDILEQEAYSAMIHITAQSYKRNWEAVLRHTSLTFMILHTLLEQVPTSEPYKYLKEVVEENMRIAAYNLNRGNQSYVTLAQTSFPEEKSETRRLIQSIDPKAFDASQSASGVSAQKSLQWNGHNVSITDPDIANRLGQIAAIKAELRDSLKTEPTNATHYDKFLFVSRELVDVVEQSKKRLQSEGVATGDAKMQNISVLETYANFSLIEATIGRDRTFVDQYFHEISHTPGMSNSGMAKKFNEIFVTQNRIVDSFSNLLELRAVIRNEELTSELERKRGFFQACQVSVVSRAVTDPAQLCNLYEHALRMLGYPESQETFPSKSYEYKLADISREEYLNVCATMVNSLIRSQHLYKLIKLSGTRSGGSPDSSDPLVTTLQQLRSDASADKILGPAGFTASQERRAVYLDGGSNNIEFTDGAAVPPVARNVQPAAQEATPKKSGFLGLFGR